MNSKTKKTAELNDLFRKSDETCLGLRILSDGIARLPVLDQYAIMRRVSEYGAFTEDTDLHGEHDFGAFYHQGKQIFWKIEYYDKTLTRSSPDPSDTEQTVRVLTTMLDTEY